MFENIINFFKGIGKKEERKQAQENSKNAAKERLHLVLMQDRANVSADFLELMKQEIIDVIKKYIEIDEKEIDVRLTNKENEDGTNGAPALYANIPILNIKNNSIKTNKKDIEKKQEEKTVEQCNQESENKDKIEKKEDNDNKINEQENIEEVKEHDKKQSEEEQKIEKQSETKTENKDKTENSNKIKQKIKKEKIKSEENL